MRARMRASSPSSPRASPTNTFPVCSFKRVFDTEPEQEVLTLAELVACFRRFELKPQLFAKVERECARIDRALEQALSGDAGVGERSSAIQVAGELAASRGEDARPAMRAKAEELKQHARQDAKKDLRLWSPVKYRDGWKERGTEGVTHVSCLVLDYDAGVRIPEATGVWSELFHLVHTTWSHTPEHPRFRVILPLAVPVPAAEFERLWDWAYERAGGDIDRQLSGVAATYALPVVPSMGAPREAVSHAGPLLDPRDLGIDVGEPLRLSARHANPSRMLGDPDKEYVTHTSGEAIYVYDDLDDDEVWSLDRARTSLVTERASRPDPGPGPVIVKHDSVFPVAKRSRVRRKTLVVDFDGVLHSYASGWRGATVVPDPPVPGALAFLRGAVDRFDIAVLSSRSRETGGIEAMKSWLLEHGLEAEVLRRLRFPRTKPPAHVYLDDRGWRFEGSFPSLEALDAFEPWHKRAPRGGDEP
jgi:hypothetical protein